MIDIPQRLIRVFDKEKYANSFLRGHVRLGLMQHYRSIEGSRRDDSEGKSQFFWKVPGPRNVIDAETGDVIRQDPSDLNIDYGGLTITPYYILCTSLP
jgi:hypothetical protein